MPSQLVSVEVLRRFLDRVERELREHPLEIPPDDHRRQLAGLLARCGPASHYELLALAADAAAAAVHGAYRRLARLTHPAHAASLGLAGREGILEVLFERATEAYLVLSDPHRRSEYDRIESTEQERRSDPRVRAEEARRVARELRERARDLLGREEYHFAIELLKQALRLDGGVAEAWALLGRAQMENPRWLGMAANSLRQALQLDPESIEHRLALAEVESRRGEAEQAERRLREVLERMPGHPAATEALECLRRNR